MLWDYSLQAMQLCTAALYSGGHQLSISKEIRERELQRLSLELLQVLLTSVSKPLKQLLSGIIDIGSLRLLHRVTSLGKTR